MRLHLNFGIEARCNLGIGGVRLFSKKKTGVGWRRCSELRIYNNGTSFTNRELISIFSIIKKTNIPLSCLIKRSNVTKFSVCVLRNGYRRAGLLC